METYREGNIEIKKVEVGPFGNNVYVLVDPVMGTSIVIDAANEADKILSEVRGTKVLAILQTHCHMDHTLALEAFRKETGAPVGIHPEEPSGRQFHPEILIEDGMDIEREGIRLKVLHTPGHTPGGVCFLMGSLLFCGDTVFPGGPGKTSSPQDFERLVESIKRKIYSLSDGTVLLPGHGASTTVGQSKEEYRVFAGKKRGYPVYGDVLWLST